MTSEYMLFWHKDVAYKFKIVWYTADMRVPQHALEDIMAATVHMDTTSSSIPQFTTGPLTVTVSSRPWEISEYLYFKRGKEVFNLFPIQFKLQIGRTKSQTKSVHRETGCNMPDKSSSHNPWTRESTTAAVASSSRNSGYGDGKFTENPATAGTTAAKRKPDSSQDSDRMALVPRKKCIQEDVDNLPLAVQECVQRVQKQTKKQLVIQKHYLPDAIYQSLLRLSGVPENDSAIRCTVVFTDPKLCMLNKKKRATRRTKPQPPMLTMGEGDLKDAGLVDKISRAITAPFKMVWKWLG